MLTVFVDHIDNTDPVTEGDAGGKTHPSTDSMLTVFADHTDSTDLVTEGDGGGQTHPSTGPYDGALGPEGQEAAILVSFGTSKASDLPIYGVHVA